MRRLRPNVVAAAGGGGKGSKARECAPSPVGRFGRGGGCGRKTDRIAISEVDDTL